MRAFGGSGDPDPKFVRKYVQHTDGSVIAPSREFESGMRDGRTVKGISDALGKINILQRDIMHIANVRILTDKK